MKSQIRILLFFIIIFFIYTSTIFATDKLESVETEEILNEQEEQLKISDFIDLSEKYTKESLEGINIKELFDSALTGRIGNTNILNNILNIFGQEFKTTIKNIRHNINCYNHT